MTPSRRGTGLCTILLIVTLLVTGIRSSWAESGPSTQTVQFTTEEADSVLTAIDRLHVTIQLQAIELRQCKELQTVQSMEIKELKSKVPSWYTKILKHPALWFCIGAYAGMKAAE